MVPLLLFGGFFLRSESVPVYFVWLKYISWFYYGAENLYVTQWNTAGACTSLPDSSFTEGAASSFVPSFVRQLNLLPIPAACDDLADRNITAANCVQRDHLGKDSCVCLQADVCATDNPNKLYTYTTGDTILAPFSYKPEYYWRNMGCLAALAVGFRLIGYLVLAFKFRKANR